MQLSLIGSIHNLYTLNLKFDLIIRSLFEIMEEPSMDEEGIHLIWLTNVVLKN